MSVASIIIIADAVSHLKTKWSDPRASKTVAVGREIIRGKRPHAPLLFYCDAI